MRGLLRLSHLIFFPVSLVVIIAFVMGVTKIELILTLRCYQTLVHGSIKRRLDDRLNKRKTRLHQFDVTSTHTYFTQVVVLMITSHLSALE